MGRPGMYADGSARVRAYRQRVRQRLAKGRRRERAAFDLYASPPAVIEATLALLEGIDPETVLDPGAHDGRWGAAAKACWPEAMVDGVELRPMPAPPGFRRWFTGDFLEGAR